MKIIMALILILLLLTGCSNNSYIGKIPYIDSLNDFSEDTLPYGIAKLSPMDISSVENFEKYKSFADNMNNMIRLLNEKSDMFNIPKLQPTLEGWQKASRYITEYGPLVDNYNDLVSKAKGYEEEPNEENLEDFYFSAGIFGFETALIAGAVFYTAAYSGVGYAYRAVGLNSLAFKCGTCVSVILSNAHWFLRTVLVEGASQLAQKATDYAREAHENG